MEGNVVCFLLQLASPAQLNHRTHHNKLPIAFTTQASLKHTPTTPSIQFIQPKPPHHATTQHHTMLPHNPTCSSHRYYFSLTFASIQNYIIAKLRNTSQITQYRTHNRLEKGPIPHLGQLSW
jgi:hypothetical protein